MLLQSMAMVAKKLLVDEKNNLCQTNLSLGCYFVKFQ